MPAAKPVMGISWHPSWSTPAGKSPSTQGLLSTTDIGGVEPARVAGFEVAG